ncbi:hypothetical protein LSAT2_006647 [Lamellibrachia satsuma]|nr:hypothetical protein LSAT2_006647 [Lamellibrachia satsuma]
MLRKTVNAITTNQPVWLLPRITIIVKQRRLNLAGHAMRHDEAAIKVLLWKPDGPRRRGYWVTRDSSDAHECHLTATNPTSKTKTFSCKATAESIQVYRFVPSIILCEVVVMATEVPLARGLLACESNPCKAGFQCVVDLGTNKYYSCTKIITTTKTETTTVTTLPVVMVNFILTGNGTEITETSNATGNGTEITMATGRGNASVTEDVTAPRIDAGHTRTPSAMKSTNRFALFGIVASLIAVMLLAIAVLARRRLRRTSVVEKKAADKKGDSVKRGSMTQKEASDRKASTTHKEASVKRGSMTQKETLVRKASMTQKEASVKRGSMTQKETSVRKAPMTQKEASVKWGSVTQKEASVKRGVMTQKETSVRKAPMTQKKASVRKESMTQKEAPVQNDSMTQKEAPVQTEDVAQKEVAIHKEAMLQKEVLDQDDTAVVHNKNKIKTDDTVQIEKTAKDGEETQSRIKRKHRKKSKEDGSFNALRSEEKFEVVAGKLQSLPADVEKDGCESTMSSG